MQRYLLRRLLLIIPTLLGVSFVVFILVRSVPGDVTALIGGAYGAADPQTKAALQKEYGLDKNIPEQYVTWLGHTSHLDFGKSILSGRSVDTEMKSRLPVTLELGVLALIFSLIIAIPIGVLSAIRQDSISDYAGRSFAIGLLAIPNFWVATMLISLAGSHFIWGVPPPHYVSLASDPVSNLKLMAMPAFILGAGLAGGVMRFTRSSMLEVLRQDYIRTAWSKGLRERVIVSRHAMRNALIPVMTIVGLNLPILVGGSVIIEQVYSIPGIGRYYLAAVGSHDYPVIEGINIVIAFAVVFANLGVDLLYSVVDPRIRYA
ncbi:MAG: ABC transporter permease [Tepidiformaceae bacterium]